MEKYRYHGQLCLTALAVVGVMFSSCSTPEPPAKRTVYLNKEQAARLFSGGGSGTTGGTTDSNYRMRRAKEYFVRGSSLQMEKRHAEAILDFQMALRLDSSAVTLYALAKNYAELERYDISLEYAQSAILRDSTFLPALETAGTSYLALGEFEKAAEIYEKLVELDSTSRQNRFLLARIYEMFNPQRAITLYTTFIGENGEDEQVLRRLVEMYHAEGDQEKYEATLARLFATTGDPLTNEELLSAYCESRNFDKALPALERAATISDAVDKIRLFGAVGQTMLETREGKPAASAEQFRTYVRIVSGERFFDWQLNFIAGMAAYSGEDFTAAATFFDRAANASESSEVPFRIGMFYLQKNDYLRAADHFGRYDSIYTAESRFALYAGYAYASGNDYNRALTALQRGTARDTVNAELWAQYGLVLDHLGKMEESDAAYETALRINPDHALSSNNLAYSLASRGIQLQRALTLAQKAIALQPRNSSFLDTYGWVLFGLGKYDDAAEYLEKAVKNGGASATVFEHLGDTYYKLGMNKDAETAYRKALDIMPERASAAERLRQLLK